MTFPAYAMLGPRPLRPEALALDGLSRRQVEAHFAVYASEIALVNDLHHKLQASESMPAGPLCAQLKSVQSHLFNAVKLHEAYFEGLGAGRADPPNSTRLLLERDFGSAANWRREIEALARQAKSWVVLAYNGDDCRLHNLVTMEGVWNAVPIVVVDMHEHAYALDFGKDREGYVDAFFKNLDWSVVEERLKRLVRV